MTYVFLLFFSFLGSTNLVWADKIVEDLYEIALKGLGNKPLEQSVGDFEAILESDRDFAPAYYQLAKLYMVMDSPSMRQVATARIRTAISLDQDHIAYQLLLADILWRRGFWFNAQEIHEKMLQKSPNAISEFKVGEYGFREFLKYHDMRGRHSEQLKIIANAEWDRARTHLEQCLVLDKDYIDAYYYLGLVYFEKGLYNDFHKVALRLYQNQPYDKDSFLFLGLAYYKLGVYEKAHELYTQSLARMEPSERAVMTSVEYITTEDERVSIGVKNNAEQLEERLRPFWNKQDPSFLTEFNERKLEHYTRVAYANLRFSRPSKHIAGWQTEKGKTYIKFGRYVARITTRPELNMNGQSVTVQFHQENWIYEGFKISFVNNNGTDGWIFDSFTGTLDMAKPMMIDPTLFLGKAALDPHVWADIKERASKANRLLSLPTSSRELIQKLPQRYIDPYVHQKYNMPYLVSAFKDRDSVRIEVAYAVPKDRIGLWKPKDKEGEVDVQNGLFLFDQHWQLLWGATDHVEFNESEWSTLTQPDSLHADGEHLTFIQRSVIKSGMYYLAAEVLDSKTKSLGNFRESHVFGFVDSTLVMSDVLLASAIKPGILFPEKRDDLNIVPNPTKTFKPTDPIYIYFEIYNLEKDSFGNTKYRLSYQVDVPKQKKISHGLFQAVDDPRSKALIQVETTYLAQSGLVRNQVQHIGLFDEEDNGSDLLAPEPETGQQQELAHFDPLTIRPGPNIQVVYVVPPKESHKQSRRIDEDISHTVTAEYIGTKADDFTYLQIEAEQLPPGVYQLRVIAEDLNSGERYVREILFRMASVSNKQIYGGYK